MVSAVQRLPVPRSSKYPAFRRMLFAFEPLWPAGRQVLPRLLPPVDGQVEQPVAVAHRLKAAPRRPISLEEFRSLSQVANDVHHAHPPSNQESVEQVLGGRVPRHFPANEVAVPDALLVRALAERGVSGVTGMPQATQSALHSIAPSCALHLAKLVIKVFGSRLRG